MGVRRKDAGLLFFHKIDGNKSSHTTDFTARVVDPARNAALGGSKNLVDISQPTAVIYTFYDDPKGLCVI